MNKFYKGKPAKLVKVHHFSGGGSVMRSESTEAAKSGREYKDRQRDFDKSLEKKNYNFNDPADRSQSRIDSALAERARKQSAAAGSRDLETQNRTGYRRMSDVAEDSVLPSERLKNSPVDIGKDDD